MFVRWFAGTYICTCIPCVSMHLLGSIGAALLMPAASLANHSCTVVVRAMSRVDTDWLYARNAGTVQEVTVTERSRLNPDFIGSSASSQMGRESAPVGMYLHGSVHSYKGRRLSKPGPAHAPLGCFSEAQRSRMPDHVSSGMSQWGRRR